MTSLIIQPQPSRRRRATTTTTTTTATTTTNNNNIVDKSNSIRNFKFLLTISNINLIAVDPARSRSRLIKLRPRKFENIYINWFSSTKSPQQSFTTFLSKLFPDEVLLSHKTKEDLKSPMFLYNINSLLWEKK